MEKEDVVLNTNLIYKLLDLLDKFEWRFFHILSNAGISKSSIQ